MRLIDIVKRDPTEWNWSLLSMNPNITIQDIENNPNLPWSTYGLSYNPNMTLDFVQNHMDRDWEWDGLSVIIPFDVIEKNLQLPWSWRSLSSVIDEDYLIQNFNKDWNWSTIIMRFPISFIEMHENFLTEKLIDADDPSIFYFLSYNPNLTFDYVKSHQYDWDWIAFSKTGKITIQDIIKNPQEPWEWMFLSDRIDINDIIQNKDLPWDWARVSKFNDTVTMQIVKDYPEINWNMRLLQANPGLTMKDIERNFTFDFEMIAKNDRLSIDFFNRHVDDFKDYYFDLSKNFWNLPITKKRKELLDLSMSMRPLNLPPYVLEHISSFTLGTPSIELWEKIKIIESTLKR